MIRYKIFTNMLIGVLFLKAFFYIVLLILRKHVFIGDSLFFISNVLLPLTRRYDVLAAEISSSLQIVNLFLTAFDDSDDVITYFSE